MNGFYKEELCEGKPSCTVLKRGFRGDSNSYFNWKHVIASNHNDEQLGWNEKVRFVG